MSFQQFLDKVESGDGDIDFVLLVLIIIGAATGIAARYFVH